MRLFFFGGSGKAERHVIPCLIEQRHPVTNFRPFAAGRAAGAPPAPVA